MTAPQSPTQTIQFVGRDGNRLVADAVGDRDAPSVLFLHGGGQTRKSWGFAMSALAARGWCTYSLDLRGHGESEWSDDGDYNLSTFAEEIAIVASTFAAPPVLVGASLGGLSALLAVGERPDVCLARALVLVDIAPRIEAKGRDRIVAFMLERAFTGFASLEEAADAVERYSPARPRPADTIGLKKNLYRRDDGRWYWHWDPALLTAGNDVVDTTADIHIQRFATAASAVTIPTLLVRGGLSDVLSRAGADDFVTLVRHAQFIEVAGAGHTVAGDNNDSFVDALVQFLDGLNRGPSTPGHVSAMG